MPTPRILALALAAVLCASAMPAAAQKAAEAEADPAAEAAPVRTEPSDPRIDAETGRDTAVYPPDRLFDHLHMKLVMDFPDPSKPTFTARQTLTLAPIGIARDRVPLRAGKAITIESVLMDGRPVEFAHADGRLDIRLPGPIEPGRPFTLATTYSATKAGGRGAGLTWSKDDSATPEVDYMFHSQGQPEANHLWFPCHDFPNERLSTELVVTVPGGYQAVSNGRLVSVTNRNAAPPPGAAPGEEPRPRSTYHWRQSRTHPYYLVALIVGRFDEVNVGGPESARPGLWMPVYGPLGSGEANRERFANTPDMIAHFEQLFDEPYPWDKYGQIICRDFAAGAMENTSITTFHSGLASRGRRGAIDGIIAHELVHQWFGDLVGYKSWEHLWLGEGWATFGEALWVEKQRGERGYQRAIAQNLDVERMRSRGTLPLTLGMVSNRYHDPDERFMSADNVYTKGGIFLHTLRKRLGEEAFWAGVRLYLDRHKFSQVETDDFRKCLEEVSGRSLERCFEQFALRPGMPRLAIDLSWDDGAGELVVSCEQTQAIDANNPAYDIDIPVVISFDESAGVPDRTLTIAMNTRATERRFRLDSKPVKAVADPERTLLADLKVRQPLAMLLRQLRDGPTLFAELQAAESLAEFADPRATAALVRTAFDPRADPLVRQTAGAAIASAPLSRAVALLGPPAADPVTTASAN